MRRCYDKQMYGFWKNLGNALTRYCHYPRVALAIRAQKGSFAARLSLIAKPPDFLFGMSAQLRTIV